MKFVYFLFILTGVIAVCMTKRFTRCELVNELRKHGFRERKLRDWVCLIENESMRQTDIVGPPNKDGSRDYGLFQINDHYWCSNTTKPGKDCHTTCSDLTTDDITKATICAKKIYTIQGFIAWHGWAKNCQNDLPDISTC